MSRLARREVIDPAEINVVHCINRTVRRCFLLGDDPISGKNFDHRKIWIEELLEHFAGCFGIDLLCYSIMSNHYHVILRTRPDVVAAWDDTEVARRWLMICPKQNCKTGSRRMVDTKAEPTEAELNSIRQCPVKLAEIRTRLSSISWWMRLLNQRVAQRANLDDAQNGRFWQDRFRAIRLIDEESLLACAAYVDLNPIRAAIAQTLEDSEHTSIQRRIQSELAEEDRRQNVHAEKRRDAFLATLTLDESGAPAGPVANSGRVRCSDKGFLAMSTHDYFELLDWSARQSVAGKKGSTPQGLPPILKRLGLSTESWTQLVNGFEQTFCLVAGRCDRIDRLRSHLTHRRFRLRSRARKLLALSA